MYIVLKSFGAIEYGFVNFITSSEEDAKQFADIMTRNAEGYHFYVTKQIN